MDRLISLIVFHLKQYSKNSYFFVNVILSTATLILFQYIAASIYGETLHDVVWLRSGIFGLWAAGTTAAGIIGIQKWQGTLLYLINNPVSDYISLAAVVIPAATFGLLSLPIAYITVSLLNGAFLQLTWTHLLYIVLLWIGAVVLDLCIATLFVLTSDAIIYEELISLPILILSGLFALPESFNGIVNVFEWVIPISLPIQWLFQQEAFSLFSLLKYSVSLAVMLSISFIVTTRIIRIAKQNGQFGGLG